LGDRARRSSSRCSGAMRAWKWAKKITGYSQPTGDWFALIAPVGIVLGRVGCLLHGCCLGKVCAPAWWTIADAHGVARWPAVPMEIGFNLAALAGALLLRCRRILPGQHFHLYLMGLRALPIWPVNSDAPLPPVGYGFTGYQFAALRLRFLGGVGLFAAVMCSFIRAVCRGVLMLRESLLLFAGLAMPGRWSPGCGGRA